MNLRGIALILGVILSLNANAEREWFDTKNSKFILDAWVENTSSSSSRKATLSTNLKWKFDKDKQLWGTPLTFSSKPYYKYSRTELTSEIEKTTSLGFNGIQVRYDAEYIRPFFALGYERERKEVTKTKGVTTTLKNLGSYKIGCEFPFGKENGASIILYAKRKYENFFGKNAGSESGIEISVNLKKLSHK